MIKRLISFGLLGASSQPQDKESVSPETRATRARQQVIQSIEARLNERRTFGEKVSDDVVRMFGNFRFALFNIIFFAAWLDVNMGYFPAIPIIDP